MNKFRKKNTCTVKLDKYEDVLRVIASKENFFEFYLFF